MLCSMRGRVGTWRVFPRRPQYLWIGLFDVETDDVVYDFSLVRRIVNQQVASRRHDGIDVEPESTVRLKTGYYTHR